MSRYRHEESASMGKSPMQLPQYGIIRAHVLQDVEAAYQVKAASEGERICISLDQRAIDSAPRMSETLGEEIDSDYLSTGASRDQGTQRVARSAADLQDAGSSWGAPSGQGGNDLVPSSKPEVAILDVEEPREMDRIEGQGAHASYTMLLELNHLQDEYHTMGYAKTLMTWMSACQ